MFVMFSDFFPAISDSAAARSRPIATAATFSRAHRPGQKQLEMLSTSSLKPCARVSGFNI